MLERIFELAQKRLEEAENEYGEQEDCFGDWAICLSVLFKTKITGKQAALGMVILKVLRENFKAKRDNRVDMCGYAGCVDRLSEDEDGEPGRKSSAPRTDGRENDLQDFPDHLSRPDTD